MSSEMKQYTGTKTIKAKPMNRLEYNKYRGWELPSKENGEDEGYLVEYEGSDSNHENHEGYVSWSPKKPFEEAYRESGEFLDRIIIEAQDTAKRLNGLNLFMASDTFSALDRGDKALMFSQKKVMSEYLQILGERIENANGKFEHN